MGCAPFDTLLEPSALWVSCLECGVPSVGVKGISRQVCSVATLWLRSHVEMAMFILVVGN